MLRRLQWDEAGAGGTSLPIASASFPVPFPSGLEFNAPARGPWNIVHTGMLVPESHQVFVCARGCLRGVDLTAAEMGAMDRLSWVDVPEDDLFNGKLEENAVEGVAYVVSRLPRRPRAVLVFLSCIQLFAGVDFGCILDALRRRFPDIVFADCYMNPTMRKSGPTPDQLMRSGLYSMLERRARKTDAVNILGNDRPTDCGSELFQMLSGRRVMDICSCRTWDEYQMMGEASLNIVYLPAARFAADAFQERLGIPYAYVPVSYGFDEIRDHHALLAEALGTKVPDGRIAELAAQRLDEAARLFAGMPVEIDYTATPRPLSLARLLHGHGFNVAGIYADAFIPEDEADFLWLQKNLPGLELHPTLHPRMRFHGRGAGHAGPAVAIGQKAAWFTGSRHFVNMVACGGHWGFDGLVRLASELEDAFFHEKDVEAVIQHKGIGLPCFIHGGCQGCGEGL